MYQVFPDSSPPMDEVLDFYFQIQSLSMTTDQGSVIAATMANGGVCPLSKTSCMSSSSVRDTLSTMHSCGLYDYSGRWAFEVNFYVFPDSSRSIFVFPTYIFLVVWNFYKSIFRPLIAPSTDRFACEVQLYWCNTDRGAKYYGDLCLGAPTRRLWQL